MFSKEQFVKAVEEIDEACALELAEQMIQGGCTKLELVDLLLLGMKLVGLRYEDGEYFIADLIMSGIIFRNILGLDSETGQPVGGAAEDCQIVVGTVEGDVHDIGKDIFISMLNSKGMSTQDLGVDVPPEAFVAAITRYHPRVLVLSGTMTFAAASMARTIDLIVQSGLREQVKIMVGGSGINQEAADQMGADGYSADLLSGPALCKRWILAMEAR